MEHGGMLGYLTGFAVVVGVIVAVAVAFGTFREIAGSLYYTEEVVTTDPTTGATVTQTLTYYYIDQSFMDAFSLAESLAGTGALLAIAALVIGLAMLLVAVIRGYAGA